MPMYKYCVKHLYTLTTEKMSMEMFNIVPDNLRQLAFILSKIVNRNA
jgi:hypothetical protein